MGATIRIGVVLAAAVACAASASKPQRATDGRTQAQRQRQQEQDEADSRLPNANYDPSDPKWKKPSEFDEIKTEPRVTVEMLKRDQSVHEDAAIRGLALGFVPYAATGWWVQITNNTKDTVSIVWDESTFVGSNAESAGRLLRASDSMTDGAQQPTPIAPGATAREKFYVEKMKNVDDSEHEMIGKEVPVDIRDKWEQARAMYTKLVVGGKIHVVFLMPDGKKRTWSGTVVPTQ